MMTKKQNPLDIFAEWYEIAKKAGIDPTVMTLATATSQGKPSLRVVLLKDFDAKGFVFYTNLESRKAHELQENPQGALCFHWPTLDKQIRIEGKVEPVTAAEADRYFATRARGSQLGAWASKQSQLMQDPEALNQRVEAMEKRFENTAVPRPEFWSGFRLIPDYIEFWQQGEHRLHSRICYHRIKNGVWNKEYLYP